MYDLQLILWRFLVEQKRLVKNVWFTTYSLKISIRIKTSGEECMIYNLFFEDFY